jgi:thioredoxin-dependent peroxiredoxin
MSTLREGQPAPDFTLADQDGQPRRLSEFRGRPVVLYFYPRASTSGCTIEAREFRDAHSQFQRRGVVVLGISPDTVKAQKKFYEAERLYFPLLADEKRAVAERYGLVKEKTMYGRKVTGVARTTLVLDKDGVIQRLFTAVKPAGHAAEVLQALRD